jgi:hypothetical protein
MRKIAVCVSNDNKEITPFKTIDAIKEACFYLKIQKLKDI